jgi:transcriptional regulator with XRE-family HTH domain
MRLRLRQKDLAAKAGVSRSLVAAVDRGELDGVTVRSLRVMTDALGADLDLFLRWRGERLDRLLDEDHAAIVEAVVRLLREDEWDVAIEVSFSKWGERGSIDVLGFHAVERALLVIEVKSVVPDSQATVSGLDRKARLAPEIARERGWEHITVSRLLVIGESSTSRRRIQRLAATYDAAFPHRGTAVRRWLRKPVGRISGLIFLSMKGSDRSRGARSGRERVRVAR